MVMGATAWNLACPFDGQPLKNRQSQMACSNGHTFDIARQGYVNLLPVQFKRSKQPGDGKEMLLARKRFLNAGYYQPVADHLAALTKAQGVGDTGCVLDAGCGEGYFLNRVFGDSHGQGDGQPSFIGLDISKAAIVESTKRNRHITWVVGSNKNPPLLDASVDLIFCVFGFACLPGFNKILKPGGKLVLVEPAADHLIQLRQVIYPRLKTSKRPPRAPIEAAQLALVEQSPIRFDTHTVATPNLDDLLKMTPHFFRIAAAGKQAVSRLQSMILTVDMRVTLWEKRGTH